MRTKKCAFCEEYIKTVALGKLMSEYGRTMHLRVCLYERVNKRGGIKESSKYHKLMRLRFCPSCGRNLED